MFTFPKKTRASVLIKRSHPHFINKIKEIHLGFSWIFGGSFVVLIKADKSTLGFKLFFLVFRPAMNSVWRRCSLQSITVIQIYQLYIFPPKFWVLILFLTFYSSTPSFLLKKHSPRKCWVKVSLKKMNTQTYIHPISE